MPNALPTPSKYSSLFGKSSSTRPKRFEAYTWEIMYIVEKNPMITYMPYA
jgi:hypothetical protein